MLRLTILSAFLLYIVFLGCNLHKSMPLPETKYFEGEIEYKVTVESLSPDISEADLISNSPDTRIQCFKDGNYVSQNYRNDSLTGRTWFDKSSHRVYIQLTGSDTLYFYDTHNIDFELEPFEIAEGEKVLDYNTQRVRLNFKGKDSAEYVTNGNQYNFYIATDLPVNPDWYKDFLEFDFNKIFATVPGIILKEEDIITGIRKVTRTATRIEQRSIGLDLSIDSTKTLIEI